MDVKTYFLNGERLSTASIFKLPETALMDVFVSDEFVSMAETAGLKGFSYKPVKICNSEGELMLRERPKNSCHALRPRTCGRD